MAFNVGRMMAFMESAVVSSGVIQDRIPERLMIDIINFKLRDFQTKTKSNESDATITTTADQQEYELPADRINIKSLYVGDYKAHKIIFDQVAELEGYIS